jgi:nucleotide-binding universal stress UspA family protein
MARPDGGDEGPSTDQQVAQWRLVVIMDGTTHGGGRVMQRIVVGVDGSAASLRALRWALAQADAGGGIVEAVTAWDIPTSYGWGPTVLDGDDLAGAAQRSLAEAVVDAHAAYPGVEVRQRVLRGHPAAVLVEEAKDADLLVVGSHGHGGFAGSLLGSVSQRCTQHATCPVVVVRTGE